MQAAVLLAVAVTMGGDFATEPSPRRQNSGYESLTPKMGPTQAERSQRRQLNNALRSAVGSPSANAFPRHDNYVSPIGFDDPHTSDAPTPRPGVSPAQFQQQTPYRGVDGLVGPRPRTAPTDPTAAFDREMTPVPPARTEASAQRSDHTDIYSEQPRVDRRSNGLPAYLGPGGANRSSYPNDANRRTRDDVRLTSERVNSEPPFGNEPSAATGRPSDEYTAPRQADYLPPSASSASRSLAEDSRFDLPPAPTTNRRRPPNSTTGNAAPPMTTPPTSPTRQTPLPNVPSTRPAYERPTGLTNVTPPYTRSSPPPSLGVTQPARPDTSRVGQIPPLGSPAPVTTPTPQPIGAGNPTIPNSSYPILSDDEIANRINQTGGSYFMTLLALFASVGLNLYLGWIAWDTYNRYQDLVADMRQGSRRERGERRLA